MFSILPHSSILAIAMVFDIGANARNGSAVSAKSIEKRLGLWRRGTELILQTLSRAGLVKSRRGPDGGYTVPRSDITVADILRAIEGDKPMPHVDHSSLAKKVILPALASADRSFAAALAQIKVSDLVAEAVRQRLN